MVQLLVEFIAPPDRIEDVLEAMHAIMRPAQLDRACLLAALWLGADDCRAIHYAEEWVSAADLDRELCRQRLGRLLDLLEIALEPPTIEVRTIERADGLDYIARARAGGGIVGAN